MKQINILAIGNSFSEDATHYLHQIALADGIKTKVVNLYIGGCSLETHWKNIEQDAANYNYQLNGMYTERNTSIKEALLEEDWDYVITQQASYNSGIEETYYPYITQMYHYIKEYAPNAKIQLHQTWAYEIDSSHTGFQHYNHNQKEMFDKLVDAYRKAAERLDLPLIPCGEVIQYARTKSPFIYEKGGISLCRDGFHLHFIYGRYMAAATWYEILFNKSIKNNAYIPASHFAADFIVDESALEAAKLCVSTIVDTYKAI